MGGSSRPILVILEQPSPYQAAVVVGLRSEVEPRGIPLLMLMADPFVAGTGPSLRRALDALDPIGAVVFVLPTPQDEEMVAAELARCPELPTVWLGSGNSGWQVGADNDLGMREAVRHLVTRCGVRTPVVVRGAPHQPDSVQREASVRAELAAHGVPLDAVLVVDGHFRREESYRAVREILATRQDLDAVIAFNDRSALGAIDAVLEVGLRVPEDVVITGFDDEDVAALSRPPLSSVNQQLAEQGAAAARLLLTQHDGSTARRLLIPTRFVARASTARNGPRGNAEPVTHANLAPDADIAPDAGLASSLWSQVATLDTALALTRSFMQCRTVGESVAALSTALPRLSVTRAFLVLVEPVTQPTQPTQPVLGRLVLAQRNRELDDVLDERPFPVSQLLPDHLHDELSTGTLGLQPLTTERGELGYLLIDQRDADRFVSEAIRMDLSRTLDAIARNAELALRADDLELLVAQRTRQLEAEAATRREAELELQRLNEELRLQLHLDGLTGICNRTGFDETLAIQWSSHSRSGSPLSLLMVDVDRFKLYNDTYGHLAGDECLRAVAACLKQAVLRPTDLVARYGGEEFVVILANTPAEGATHVARRLREALVEQAIPHATSEFQVVTVSVGVATCQPGPTADPTALIRAADQALYAAKNSGRDRVCADTGAVLFA